MKNSGVIVIPSREDGEGSSSFLRGGFLASLGMTASQQLRSFDGLSLRKSGRTKGANIDRRFSFHDHLGDQLADRWRVHDAVARRSVREEEVVDAGRGSKEHVTIGRHLVEAGPALCAIDRDVRRLGNAFMGQTTDLLQPLLFE